MYPIAEIFNSANLLDLERCVFCYAARNYQIWAYYDFYVKVLFYKCKIKYIDIKSLIFICMKINKEKYTLQKTNKEYLIRLRLILIDTFEYYF